MDLTNYVVSPGPNGNLTGSLCCFVSSRADATQRFALGCQHVLARGSKNGCRPVPHSVLKMQPSGEVIGELYSWGSVYPDQKRYSMDAAITSVAPSQKIENRFGKRRIQDSLLPGDNPSFGNYTLCTPRLPGVGTSVEFVGTFFERDLEYTCGAVRFKTLFKFKAATEDGDSGSAILTAGGTLVGMHIYGALDEHGQSYSYAIPASALFDDSLFSVAIDLI